MAYFRPLPGIVIFHVCSGASLEAQLVKNPPAMQETLVRFLGGTILWRRDSYTLQYSWASLVAQMIKHPPAVWETWV